MELRGGPDVNRIFGEGDNDRINAGPGNDSLFGSGDNDRLFRRSGRDALDGGFGVDRCNGGANTDTAHLCEVESSIP
jgi:Ca2+-binding RTX toxin-like protein